MAQGVISEPASLSPLASHPALFPTVPQVQGALHFPLMAGAQSQGNIRSGGPNDLPLLPLPTRLLRIHALPPLATSPGKLDTMLDSQDTKSQVELGSLGWPLLLTPRHGSHSFAPTSCSYSVLLKTAMQKKKKKKKDGSTQPYDPGAIVELEGEAASFSPTPLSSPANYLWAWVPGPPFLQNSIRFA